jgi:hypothetical protein
MTLEDAMRLAGLHVDKAGRFLTAGGTRFRLTLVDARPTGGGFCVMYHSEPIDGGGGGIDGPVLVFVMNDGAVLNLGEYIQHPDSD